MTKPFDYVTCIKWIATLFLLLAVAVRSVEEVPRIYDVIFSWISACGWLYVSLMWKDRALILLNPVIGFMLLTALVRYTV